MLYMLYLVLGFCEVGRQTVSICDWKQVKFGNFVQKLPDLQTSVNSYDDLHNGLCTYL